MPSEYWQIQKLVKYLKVCKCSCAFKAHMICILTEAMNVFIVIENLRQKTLLRMTYEFIALLASSC